MSLFGVQQLATMLTEPQAKQQARKAEAAFYTVTQVGTDQFNDLIWAAFQVGDDLQRSIVDLAFDIVTLRAFDQGYMGRLVTDIARQSQETLATFTQVDNFRIALRELKNNYEVFNLVKGVGALLNIPSASDFPLEELVEKAYALGTYPALWAIEGLGHDYAMTFWGSGKPIRNILNDGQARRLPAKSLAMMHAGLGLAFAEPLVPTPRSAGCFGNSSHCAEIIRGKAT